jgi:hypothetical protein
VCWVEDGTYFWFRKYMGESAVVLVQTTTWPLPASRLDKEDELCVRRVRPTVTEGDTAEMSAVLLS